MSYNRDQTAILFFMQSKVVYLSSHISSFIIFAILSLHIALLEQKVIYASCFETTRFYAKMEITLNFRQCIYEHRPWRVCCTVDGVELLLLKMDTILLHSIMLCCIANVRKSSILGDKWRQTSHIFCIWVRFYSDGIVYQPANSEYRISGRRLYQRKRVLESKNLRKHLSTMVDDLPDKMEFVNSAINTSTTTIMWDTS